MGWLESAAWGLAGAFLVEALDLWSALRRRGTWPWNVHGPGPTAGPLGYAVAEVARLVVGGVLAAGAAASGQVSGPMAALAIGVASPWVVERLTALVPLPNEQFPLTDPQWPQPSTPGDSPEAVPDEELRRDGVRSHHEQRDRLDRGEAAREGR